MTKKPQTSKDAAEKVVKNIRRKTRQTYSAEEKIRILSVLYDPSEGS
jgi:transposase